MKLMATLFLTTTMLLPLVLAQSDYCALSPQHTMCQYKGVGPACNGQPSARGVTQQEIINILSVHNRYRSLIARGEEDRGSPGAQPPAANMKQMIWDNELSKIAQRHADQCKFAHDCSDCRKTKRFGVGQNLYIYKQTLASPENDWDKAVTDWYEEVTLFSNRNVEPFQFSSPTGHYTQLVWADTDKVGCGATSYKDGRWFATLYTCNYGPGGNYIAGQMYRQGPACSACSQGDQCSQDFPGLCVSEESGLSTPEKIPSAMRNTSRTQDQPRKSIKNIVVKTTKLPHRFKVSKTTPRPTRTTTVQAKKAKITTKRPTATIRAITTTSNDLEDLSVVGNELFTCKFNYEEENCIMKNNGKAWTQKQKLGNKYQEIELFNQEKAEFFFSKLISPPASKLACLDFRFKKFSTDGARHILTVLAWPSRGKPGKVSIVQDSPDQFTWVRAQVTFKKVDRDFLLMFRARGPQGGEGSLTLAVDDVRVTRGRCGQ